MIQALAEKRRLLQREIGYKREELQSYYNSPDQLVVEIIHTGLDEGHAFDLGILWKIEGLP